MGGALSQAAGSLDIEIGGPAPGTQYDQLKVKSTVTLGGALSLSVGFTPAVGARFTIINNAGSGAVAGTFAGLPQGATITAGGAAFQISYAGGDGNDVVLSAVASPTVTAVGVNAGAIQRSMVTSIQVTFSAVVAVAPGAFRLTYLGAPAGTTGGVPGSTVGGFQVTMATVGGVTVATLSAFTGTDTGAGSLIDGRYALTIKGGAVTANGVPMTSDFSFADSGTTTGNQLYRLYGDASGDRLVSAADLTLFRAAFGSGDLTFDADGDGVVTAADLAAFRTNYGMAM